MRKFILLLFCSLSCAPDDATLRTLASGSPQIKDDGTVVVAVIDTGVDIKHPELKNSIWVNAKEATGKRGIDDDKNGYVDDVNGWDFVTQTPQITDPHGHGTHVSGVIKTQSLGTARIMSLRYYNSVASGQQNLRNSIEAIQYAIQNGARIINYSGGGAEFSSPEYRALELAASKGILFVAAAGNEKSNADEVLYFPAAYKLDNILSVTAIRPDGQIAAFANWGKENVDIGAPGFSVLSLTPGGGFGYMSGTSQAAAYTTGVATLIYARRPSLTVSKIIKFVKSHTKSSGNLERQVKIIDRDSISRDLKETK